MTVLKHCFSGEYTFLSNFWLFEKPMEYQGMQFRSSEHFYMAMKTKSLPLRKRISECATGAEAKKAGRSVKLRSDWEEIKFDVMLYALRYKFSNANPTLRGKLLATGDTYLQEGNFWNDKIWGVCMKTGDGENNLGRLLMQVREEIRNET